MRENMLALSCVGPALGSMKALPTAAQNESLTEVSTAAATGSAAETLGLVEALDAAILVKGFIATSRGLPLDTEDIDLICVVDAKDV